MAAPFYFTFHQQCTWVLISSHPHQQYLFSIIVMLMNVKWCFNVVLTYISLMTGYVTHLLKCFLYILREMFLHVPCLFLNWLFKNCWVVGSSLYVLGIIPYQIHNLHTFSLIPWVTFSLLSFDAQECSNIDGGRFIYLFSCCLFFLAFWWRNQPNLRAWALSPIFL